MMEDYSSLIAASISAVFIIGLMATYVQIMNYLIDKQYVIKKSLDKTQQEINKSIQKLRWILRFLALQELCFFVSLFLLLTITGYLINDTLVHTPFLRKMSFAVIGVLGLSQILHLIVFWRSYFWEYICGGKK